MKPERLKISDIDELMKLFYTCFFEDHFYAQEFPDPLTRLSKMQEICRPSIEYCLHYGHCLGVKTDKRLIASIICFDYNETRTNDIRAFRMIFSGNPWAETLPYDDSIHKKTQRLGEKVIYLLSVAVDQEYRNKGVASRLVDNILRTFPSHYVVGDVSNQNSLSIYRKRDFEISMIEPNYYLVVHSPDELQNTHKKE